MMLPTGGFRPILAIAAVAAALVTAGSGRADQAADDAYERPYQICAPNVVDRGTYNGYRRYHAYCHVCHGPDGLGSSYAPNLVDSLKVMKRDDFSQVVAGGRQNLAAGKESVMPAFYEVADVMNYLEDIYAYLKARSDGKLGRGRPERCPS
jgi:methanol metabolism-related c-type cytochrome